MRPPSKKHALIACAITGVALASKLASAQAATASDGSQQTCAALLADGPGVSAIGPDGSNDSTRSGVNNTQSDTTRRIAPIRIGADTSAGAGIPQNRSDTASFGIGGARSGKADVVLWVGVHADQVRFASQPHVRVRLCWGGDTLRVVQRTNIPLPVVAGTTYRNVYVAVELVGRLNGECLANALGVGSGAGTASPNAPPRSMAPAPAPGSTGSCAFLGGSAGAGAQTTRTPGP
jgi:hypothetical protein